MGQATCRFGVRRGKADVFGYGTEPPGPHLSKTFSAVPRVGLEKGHFTGQELVCNNPVEASVFFLASLAVPLLPRGLGHGYG